MSLPLNIDWQQILLHLFNFVILGGGLYFLLYKPVKGFMDKRQEHYNTLDQETSANLAQAEQLKEDYHKRMELAQNEIETERAAIIKHAHEVSDKIVQEAQDQAAKILSDVRKEAQREKGVMLYKAQEEITNLAAMATKKLLLDSEGTAFDQFLNAAESGKEKTE